MKEIVENFKDKNGYIDNLDALYEELKKNKYSIKDIITEMYNIKMNNEKILRQIELDNKEKKKLLEHKKNNEVIDYIKKEETTKKTKIKQEEKNDEINLEFYFNYINNAYENDKFLDILPKDNSKESITIIDTILACYLKEIKFLEYNLVLEQDKDSINYITDELYKFQYIFNKILEYKNNLNSIKEETFKNNLVYFMEGNIPKVLKNLEDESIETIKSIIKLIKSIENGSFINLKSFQNYNKLKGIFEVRDIKHRTRVYFEMVGGHKYAIISSLINKTDTDKKFFEYITSEVKKYRENTNNIESIDINNIKKLVLGDNNG